MNPIFLKNEDQIDLFFRRGMEITDKTKHIAKLEHISYYRLKEFAKPYSVVTMYGEVPVLKYKDISFDDVVKRYYQDKNLRINLLHAIEKIEVSIKRNISYILGKRYGAFGYLNFSLWANKNENSKFKLEKEQFYFKRDLLKVLSKSSMPDLANGNNLNEDGFPSVWIATEILMFGSLVHLISLMSKRNQKELAQFYNCTIKELLSWLKCLNFARNICAHNSNIIDIQLQTKPVVRKAWSKKYLYSVSDKSGNKVVTNRISVIILIVITLVKEINNKYRWKPIRSNLASICKDNDIIKADKNANLLGFANSRTALDLQSFSLGNL